MTEADSNYEVCSRCVMDVSARDIVFDECGRCNFCTEFLEEPRHHFFSSPSSRLNLDMLVDRVKADGLGKPYDCVVGVSGGVDSSYALVKAVQLGLRPLAVHMDNGWDSELAQRNISNLVKSLGVDLLTHVIEWDEYRGLMQAFFDSDVIDIELLYDNAMLAVNYRAARRFGLRYILSGSNHATEGMRLPQEWAWYKSDKRNIKDISRRHGGPKLRSFPAVGTIERLRYRIRDRIEWVYFLDALSFEKELALELLESQFAYRRYPYKHYESIFTRFYQGYLLPRKFQVDKRRLHLSSLVVTGQMSRAEAMAHFSTTPYPDVRDLESDLAFFLQKMRWTQEDLENYLRRPRREHSEYASERWMNSCIQHALRIARHLS